MDKKTEITIKSYNKTVESFIKRTDPLRPKPLSDIFLRLIKENVKIENKIKILDLGCAQGRDVKYFIKKGYEVIGIDLSEKLIEKAKKECSKANFKIMDMRKLNFPDNSFDAIWANAALVHVPKKDVLETLKGIITVMKNKGIMMVCVKTRTDGENKEIIEVDKRHENVEKFWSYFSKEEFTDYLEKSGFKIIETIEKNYSNENRDYGWINYFCIKIK